VCSDLRATHLRNKFTSTARARRRCPAAEIDHKQAPTTAVWLWYAIGQWQNNFGHWTLPRHTIGTLQISHSRESLGRISAAARHCCRAHGHTQGAFVRGAARAAPDRETRPYRLAGLPTRARRRCHAAPLLRRGHLGQTRFK